MSAAAKLTDERKTILAVEDAKDYQLILRSALAQEYDVTIAGTAAEALAYISTNEYDLFILDIGLPDKDGFAICSHIRGQENTKETPIIFVTSQTQVPEKMLAFSLGADDYVTKPFHLGELKARVAARMRRPGQPGTTQTELECGKLKIDIRSQRVFVLAESEQPKQVELTRREFDLLLYLARNQDALVSREQILGAVWSQSVNVTDRVVDAHISKIRRKLGSCSEYIESVHGSGYRFSIKA